MTIDSINKIRKDFPILQTKINNKNLIYLDNAATTQKPVQVIEAMNDCYYKFNSNIHRGVHYLSEKMTEAYENARREIQSFINAEHPYEIIFTSGTTGAINLVAACFGEKFIHAGDEILISAMEHHSNIVPWQLICERKDAKLKVIPITKTGEIIFDEYLKLLTERTKLVAIAYVSNSLGTVNPVRQIIEKAHLHNIPVLLDAAQAVQHTKIDVKELNCDFLAFSGHKIYGPTGIGVLYGKEKWLNEIPPYQGGGDMIKSVSFEKTNFAELPFKFEAGTTNFIGAIGLAKGINYLKNIGFDNVIQYEKELLDYATQKLIQIPGLKIYGQAKEKASVISFLLDNIHFFDTGKILDNMGIAVRTGHHCTQPLMHFFGIEGTVRASFAFYNTYEEIDKLYEGILKVIKLF